MRSFGDVVSMLFEADIWVDFFESLLGGSCFVLACLLGPEEEAVHIGELNGVVVEEEELADAAPSEHFGGHGADASESYDEDGQVTDAFVIFNDAHALEGHEPAVGVAVDGLGRHGLDFGAWWQ